MTPLQKTLISSNLLIMFEKKNRFDSYIKFLGFKYANECFTITDIDNIGLFKYQKRQLVINAQNSEMNVPERYEHEFPKKTAKVADSGSLVTIETLKSDSKFIDSKPKKLFVKSDKSKASVVKKKSSRPGKEISKSVDKERWMPLRDRSYYKSKEQYQKSIKMVVRSNK